MQKSQGTSLSTTPAGRAERPVYNSLDFPGPASWISLAASGLLPAATASPPPPPVEAHEEDEDKPDTGRTRAAHSDGREIGGERRSTW